MLQTDRINWSNLISFTSSGLKVASYTEIRAAVVDMFKNAYGNDIDLSSATADGVYVENYCLIINNILQSFKTFYASLNVNEASGKYLDVLAALTNVYRKKPTKSSVTLTLTLDDSAQGDYTASSIKFVDKAGTTWTARAIDTQEAGNEYVISPGQSIVVKATCDVYGPVRAPVGWIDRTVDNDVSIEVEQLQAATVGNAEESDNALRLRRSSSTGTSANSVLEALVGELYKIDGIEDVKIYNNDAGSSITTKGNVTVATHEVYVILRELGNSDISDALIGTTIYENMTPGIKTTVGSNSFIYTQSFLGQSITLTVPQVVNWQVAVPIHTKLTITISPKQYFASNSTLDLIGNAVMDFANQLRLGEDLTVRDVYDVIENADPLFRGRATFDIVSVAANDVVKALGANLVDSADVYFDYTTITTSQDNDNFIIELN